MSGRDEAPSGPLDVETLDVLARRATTHPLVSGWAFRPDSISPRVLELELDDTRYPASVTEVRLDVHWFVGGDYTVHYLERHEEGRWQCRWDRHPRPDATRAHFHPPPDASGVEPPPLETEYHLDVVFEVLEWVTDRNRELLE
ncbi:hypothetical protein [Natronobiforma cellulositropha]|uniref:hypothetical protein n=1 Tax=Natronobiforma cellulositropha TaxID=1679076 RepID=UPI0021D5B6AD|nr:hypothetical protein [Natronobiforma cellulositropha]